MKILALDSSGLVASVAILDENQVIAEYTVNYKKTHSQTLLPMVDEIVTMTGQDLSDLAAIAVAAGPGSFTGLRIGSATAKGLGLALEKPLVSVPTLEGLAYNLYGTDRLVCPMMDARRQQVYTGLYTWQRGETDPASSMDDHPEFCIVRPQTACPVEEILTACIEEAGRTGRSLILLGDGVPVYEDLIRQRLDQAGVPYSLAPSHMNRQRAGSVGVRALALLAEGKEETAAAHAPIYLRKSQAERELEKKRSRGSET